MEEVKEVVQIASAYLKALIEQAKDVRLEQIEQPKGSQWSVILSFPDDASSLASAFSKAANHRVFKEVIVDSKAKQGKAIKVWSA